MKEVALQLQAVLLDVGGVLVDETQFHQLMQVQLLELLQHEGFSVSSKELTELLQQVMRSGLSTYRHAILWHFVKPDIMKFQRLRTGLQPLGYGAFSDYQPKLASGAQEVVARLSQKYRLAIAANQGPRIKEFLRTHEVLQYFVCDQVSDEMGLAKPNPLFFQIILDSLGIRAEEAIMVGDRLDNDIAPAKRLGMKTIRLMVWPFSLQGARMLEEQPDLTIQKLSELPKAVEELSEA